MINCPTICLKVIWESNVWTLGSGVGVWVGVTVGVWLGVGVKVRVELEVGIKLGVGVTRGCVELNPKTSLPIRESSSHDPM